MVCHKGFLPLLDLITARLPFHYSMYPQKILLNEVKQLQWLRLIRKAPCGGQFR